MNILGIMSGTSCDGLDLCNVKIDINPIFKLLISFIILYNTNEESIEKI